MATHIASSKKTILLASARARNTRPRKTTRRPRQGNLSQSQAAACRKAAETRKKVQKEIELEHRRQTSEAERIATAYGVGLKGVLRRVKNASKAVKKRKPNVHNAFIFMKSLDLSNRPGGGEVTKLMDLQRQFKNYQTYAEFRDSDPEFVKDVVAALVEHKKEKATSGRPHRGAHANDVTTTCKNIEDELNNLQRRCETRTIMIVVRSDPSHPNRPYFAVDSVGTSFIESVLGMSLEDLGTKFEAYAVAGINGLARNDNEKRNLLKKSVRLMLRNSLRDITLRPDIEMQYARYETDIVHKYGVELSGWPQDSFALDRFSRDSLQDIVNGLRCGSIKWTKLTEEDLNARINTYKATAKVKPRKRTRKESAVTSGSEGAGQGSHIGEGVGQGPHIGEGVGQGPHIDGAPAGVPQDAQAGSNNA